MTDNKNRAVENFDLAFNYFLSAVDWRIHRDSTANLLKIFGDKKRFLTALKTNEGNLAELLISMRKVVKDLSYPRDDREAMKVIGERAANYHHHGEYQKIMELANDMVFRHVIENLGLQKRPDFNKLTDHDLFGLGILPKEIFYQFFIIETLAKDKRFDWNRDEKIINQTFIAAGICFADIYEYFELAD